MRYPWETEEDSSNPAALDVLCRLDGGETSVGKEQGLLDERPVCGDDIMNSRPFLPWTKRQLTIENQSGILTVIFRVEHGRISDQGEICDTELVGLFDEVLVRFDSFFQGHAVERDDE